ncbi:hypothetical protein EAF04_010572 [Stromatinia cepivora]|nr:hypothetical protein EAF04_010572 [Stromatinia cepivora]
MMDLQSLLRSWNKNRDSVEDVLGYALQKDYGSKVAYKDLQGADRRVVGQLRNACKNERFYGRVIEDITKSSFSLIQVNELNGTRICNKSSFTEESMIQEDDISADAEPKYQKYERYHDFLSETYYRSVVLIMPRDHKFEFLLSDQSHGETDRFINVLLDIPRKPSDIRGSILEDFTNICERMVEVKPGSWGLPQSGFSHEALLKMLTLIVNLDHQKLFECALPAYFWNAKTISLMVTMARRRGNDWLSITIAKYLTRIDRFYSRSWAIEYVASRTSQDFKLDPDWKATQFQSNTPAMLNLPVFQRFFQRSLNWYIIRYKPMEPKQGVTWARSARGCGHYRCKLLDAFLNHPKRIRHTFSIDASGIKHLESRLLVDVKEKSIKLSRKGLNLVVEKLPVMKLSNSRNSDEVTSPPLNDMMATAAQSGSLQIGNSTSPSVPGPTSNNVSSGKNSRKRGLPSDHSSSDGPANEMHGQKKRIVSDLSRCSAG